MSEDWKNDRAEAAMKDGTEAIRKAAVAKAKMEEDQKWENVKITLYVGDSNYDGYVDSIIDKLREEYQLPIKK